MGSPPPPITFNVEVICRDDFYDIQVFKDVGRQKLDVSLVLLDEQGEWGEEIHETGDGAFTSTDGYVNFPSGSLVVKNKIGTLTYKGSPAARFRCLMFVEER